MNMVVAVGCPSEEAANLVRCHIWDHLCALMESVFDIVDVVGLHNAQHHLPVDRQWHVYLSAFHHGGPMLVADSMTEFYRDAYDLFGSLTLELREVDLKHGIQTQTQHNHLFLVRIIVDHVAVYNLRLALECHGIFVAMVALGEETALLRSPLVKND